MNKYQIISIAVISAVSLSLGMLWFATNSSANTQHATSFSGELLNKAPEEAGKPFVASNPLQTTGPLQNLGPQSSADPLQMTIPIAAMLPFDIAAMQASLPNNVEFITGDRPIGANISTVPSAMPSFTDTKESAPVVGNSIQTVSNQPAYNSTTVLAPPVYNPSGSSSMSPN